jgi:Zn finger protein HypA/HybF involved in hydrogenase expression
MFKATVKCLRCEEVFPINSEETRGFDPKYPEDWEVNCPRCDNWEVVGNGILQGEWEIID